MDTRSVTPGGTLRGELRIPGDKSISHRAAILASLAPGRSHIHNFLRAQDCLNTLAVCAALGAQTAWQGEVLEITGSAGPLRQPEQVLDCGNSGTGVRLLAGVLASQPFTSTITGDEQIQRRPMQRIITPLEQMGARIESRPGGRCPLIIHGNRLNGISYHSPIASAQVKSCVLLAGLSANGQTQVEEPALSRDHTERTLAFMGVQVRSERLPGRGGAPFATRITMDGGQRPLPSELTVAGDISSAAFFIIAAALLPGSEIFLPGIGTNPTREGLIPILRDHFGMDIQIFNPREISGEPVADFLVRGHAPDGSREIVLDRAEAVPTYIDEIPILVVAAALAARRVEFRHAEELRVKEVDRIAVLAAEYAKLGIRVEELPDGMVVHGGPILGGRADSHGDHRLAMSMAMAGLLSQQGVEIINTKCVSTSFPGFWELLERGRSHAR